MLVPPPVSPGDCIGLFSPAGPVRDQNRFDAGLKVLHELGFRTKLYRREPSEHEYLAADDRARAQEFHVMWDDQEVDAMMAVRGGYGCLRMLPRLDLEMLRERPKAVIGFSDLTVLLNTLADRAGIVTMHGPVLTSLAGSDQGSIDSFVSGLSGFAGEKRILESIEVLREGSASGTLRGGNLTTLAHLLGTPWEVPFKGTLLILEDTGEPIYRIDRILTQLYLSGRLDQLSGILLGSFDCGTGECENLQLQKEVWERVLELTAHCGYPVWGKVPIGHREVNHTLPLGVEAVMDGAACSLEMIKKMS